MNIEDVIKEAFNNAYEHGFWDPCLGRGTHAGVHKELAEKYIPEKIALMHSELSEALECYRAGEMLLFLRENGKPEGFSTELADCFIRICDLVGALGLDKEFVKAIEDKMFYNKKRPYKHGKQC